MEYLKYQSLSTDIGREGDASFWLILMFSFFSFIVMDPMNQPRTPQKEVLQRMRPQFVEFLNFDTPNFLEKLYHKSVINDAIKIKVKRKDQLQKNRIILDYLEMQPSVVFDEFLEILQDVYPQLHKEAQDMSKYWSHIESFSITCILLEWIFLHTVMNTH